MTKESNLLVTFSKRRSGLFKKASELCTLCGVEIAIIVFSPGKKVFSFGHPCVELIVDRFLTQNANAISSTSKLLEAHRNANVRDLNRQLTDVLSQLEIEKKRSEELDKLRKASQGMSWWEAPIDKLGLQQLEHLKIDMEELKKNIVKQAQRFMVKLENPAQILHFSGSRGLGGHSINVGDSQLDLSTPPYGYAIGLNMVHSHF